MYASLRVQNEICFVTNSPHADAQQCKAVPAPCTMSVQGDSDSDAEAGARTPLLGSRGDDGSAASGARQRKADTYGHAATRAHESAQSVGSVGSDAPSRPGRKTLLGKKKRASAAAADPPLKGLKRVAYAVGMVCIVVMVLSWVAASELTQLVGSTYDYYEPVLLVWAAHTTFIAMTPVMLVAYARQRRESGRTATPLHMFVVEQIRTNFGSLKRGLIVCSLLGFMYTGSSIIWYTGTLLLPAGIASAVAQVRMLPRTRYPRSGDSSCAHAPPPCWSGTRRPLAHRCVA